MAEFLSRRLLVSTILILPWWSSGQEPTGAPEAEGPYAIEAIEVPPSVTGQVASFDFGKSGERILLGRDGKIFWKLNQDDEWHSWSDHGLEGATGLFTGYWPKSLYVVHATGIHRLFDTDDDQKVDFLKAAIPGWRFSTLGQLFKGSPAVTPAGTLLLAPNVTEGDWSGVVMAVPEDSPVVPWIRGPYHFSHPSPGPAGSWLLVGKPSPPTEDGPPTEENSSSGLWIIPSPGQEEGKTVENEIAEEEDEDEDEEQSSPDPDSEEETGTNDTGDSTPPPAPPAPLVTDRPSIYLPSSLLPTGPVTPALARVGHDEDQFGAFSGQVFLGGSGSNRLLRVILDRVGDTWQGAVTNFAEIESPQLGMDFLRFTPSGDELVVGKDGYLFSIQPTGNPFYAIESIRRATDGFEITFTTPFDRESASNPDAWKIETWQPGMEESITTPIDAGANDSRFVIDFGGRTVTWQTDSLEEGLVYLFDLSAITSESGEVLSHGPIYFTLNASPAIPQNAGQPMPVEGSSREQDDKAVPAPAQEEDPPTAPEAEPETGDAAPPPEGSTPDEKPGAN